MPESGHLARTWAIVTAIIAVLGLVGAIVGVNTWIDRKIDARTSDPAFIRQVASQVRPALIFDSNGSIIADLGAMQYFDEISVTFHEGEKKPGEIILKPKVLLGFPPEITGMGGVQIFPAAQRGPGLTWRYEVEEFYIQKETVSRPFRFRLEVIK
jgi:hypothetical protein